MEESEVLQVKVKGVNLNKMMDLKLLGHLDRELKDFKIIGITVITGTEKDAETDIISMQHPSPDDEKEDIALIDVSHGSSLKKILKSLKDYFNELDTEE